MTDGFASTQVCDLRLLTSGFGFEPGPSPQLADDDVEISTLDLSWTAQGPAGLALGAGTVGARGGPDWPVAVLFDQDRRLLLPYRDSGDTPWRSVKDTPRDAEPLVMVFPFLDDLLLALDSGDAAAHPGWETVANLLEQGNGGYDAVGDEGWQWMNLLNLYRATGQVDDDVYDAYAYDMLGSLHDLEDEQSATVFDVTWDGMTSGHPPDDLVAWALVPLPLSTTADLHKAGHSPATAGTLWRTLRATLGNPTDPVRKARWCTEQVTGYLRSATPARADLVAAAGLVVGEDPGVFAATDEQLRFLVAAR